MSYRRKHVKNKIHRIKPKKSVLKRPIFWYLVLFFVIVCSGIYFALFFSPLWVVNITISGNEKVKTDEIKNLVLTDVNKKIIGGFGFNVISKSIFFANSAGIKKQILNRFPLIASAAVTKNFPQSIDVKVRERKPFAVFCSSANSARAQNDCFFIDDTGVIFQELQEIPPDMVIVRQAFDSRQVFAGEDAINQSIMSAISKIEKNLKDNFQINLTDAVVSTPVRLDVKTNENWQIYFSLEPDSDISLQLTKLSLLLQQQIASDARKNLQYVDLRFKDRAYYK
jgi:cell division septal protein FtsQ